MAGLNSSGAARGLRMGFNMADRVIARQDEREARQEQQEWREQRAQQEDQFRERQISLREQRQENKSEWREKEWERDQERYEDQKARQAEQEERAEELHDLKVRKNRYNMDQNLLQDGLKTAAETGDPGAVTERQKQAGDRLGIDFEKLGSGEYEDARQKVTNALTKQVMSDVKGGMQPDMPGDASSPERLASRLNDPEMLEATNTYLEPFVQNNIGKKGRDGTKIVDSEIVGAYPDDEGSIGYEMEVQTAGGDTYKAPVTMGRSGEEGDDQVKPVSVDKLMDHVRGVTQITNSLEQQSVRSDAKQRMKSRFPDSYDEPTYRSTQGEDGRVTLWNENDPSDRVTLDLGGGDGEPGAAGSGSYTSLLEDHTEMRQRSSTINDNLKTGFVENIGTVESFKGLPQSKKDAHSQGAAAADSLDRMLLKSGVKLSESQLSNIAFDAYQGVPDKEEIRKEAPEGVTDKEVDRLYQKELDAARKRVMKRGSSLIKRARKANKPSRKGDSPRQGQPGQEPDGEQDVRQQSLANAREAINNGKNPKAVIDTLRDNGFSPDEIESAGIQLPRGDSGSEPSEGANRPQPEPREEPQSTPEPRQASPEPQQSGGAQRRQSRQNKTEGFGEPELADLSESELVRIAQGRHGISPTERQGTGRTAESRRLSRDELISRILRAQETSSGESAQPRQQAPRGRGLRNQ